MSWLPILALALAAFAIAALVVRLPRSLYTLFGAALLFGLAGYALQGSPGQPASPGTVVVQDEASGEMLVAARREFFGPDSLPARHVLSADAYARRGDYAGAADFLRNAVIDDPENAEAWLALGMALVEHAEGRLTPAALYALSEADRLAPGNAAPRYFLGLTQLRNGEAERALELWREALADSPADASWREGLAQRIARLEAILAEAEVQAQQAPQAPSRPGTPE